MRKTDLHKIKYKLEKADGSPVDPNGEYFVLKLNSKDIHHRKASCDALKAYAESIMDVSPRFAGQLMALVSIYRPSRRFDASSIQQGR